MQVIKFERKGTRNSILNALRIDMVAAKMASTNGYAYGAIASTIYIAKGSSADYHYWKTKSLSLAVEMGN